MRTLRRYITMLQDVGIPIIAERGRGGAYMLGAGYRLPPWFNEGMAEVFSTITESGNKTLFGRPIAGRLQALQTEPWVPLKTPSTHWS